MTVLWGHLTFSWNREQWPCELIHTRPVVRSNQKALWSVFFSSTIFFNCFFLQVPTPEIRAHNLCLYLCAYGIKVTSATEDSLSLHARIRHPGFHVKKSMNLLTPVDGFGMPSLWFQSCWISPSYFQQFSKYRKNWVQIYLYFEHLRNSIVLSTFLCVVLFSNKDCHQCCYYIKLCSSVILP